MYMQPSARGSRTGRSTEHDALPGSDGGVYSSAISSASEMYTAVRTVNT